MVHAVPPSASSLLEYIALYVGRYRMTGAFARMVMEHSRHRCPRSPLFAHLGMAFSLAVGIFDMRLAADASSRHRQSIGELSMLPLLALSDLDLLTTSWTEH